ncbi:MAG: zinc-ribbon domain-containing protein [Nitrososphaerales archaeon]
MYCPKCGADLPDDAAFCMKCGAQLRAGGSSQSTTQSGSSTSAGGYASSAGASQTSAQKPVLAPQGATSFKCPNCGAPIAPKFGEMVITCEYCGSGVTLGNQGWSSIQKQSMLPLKMSSKDQIIARTKELMDHGLLKRHLQESSKLEEISLTYVPYWIMSVSARTSIVSIDETAQVANIATTAALIGVLGGFGGGFGRRAFNLGSIFGSIRPGNIMAFGMGFGMMGGGGGMRRTHELDENYNYPIIALKALTDYQPKEYQFHLDERAIFDLTKVPKGIKVLNGDISEEVARSQAKTLVDQLQSQKAHQQYHMIQQIHTEEDVADAELMYAPVWFARYDHKGDRIALVIDGNSGNLINSIGL